MIRWGLQHKIIEIPKSGDRQHLKENGNVFDFELDAGDMNQMDGLNEDLRVTDDPHNYKFVSAFTIFKAPSISEILPTLEVSIMRFFNPK